MARYIVERFFILLHRSVPAMRRNIKNNSVRVTEFVFCILWQISWARMVLATVSLNLFFRLGQIINPKTKVMDSYKILTALITCIILISKLQES